MNRRAFSVAPLLVAIALLPACADSQEVEEERVGDAPSAALNANALNANALDANALYADALTPSMLSPTPLSPSSLSSTAWGSLTDPGERGDLARALVKYAVGCAFNGSQSFRFSWTDSGNTTHDETYVGELGLATGWETSTLSTTGQRWVSACLASRVNYLGVSVMLSSRGANDGLATSSSELSSYTAQEGAFWGNLFDSPQTAFACDDVADDAHSRAADRFCAAGYDDGSGSLQSCGIIKRVGSCATACGSLGSSGYYSSCSPDGGQSFSSEVITVFLQ